MNISKFTQKSIEAVNNLEKVAYQFGHQEIEEEHLLYSLLHQEDSLIAKLIEKMEIQKEYFEDRLDQALNGKVKVSGGSPYIGQYLNRRSSALRMWQSRWETSMFPLSICSCPF